MTRWARQDTKGRWRMTEEKGGICHLIPVDWSRDERGHWPHLQYVVQGVDVSLGCPSCQARLLFKAIEYVFGVCRRDQKDMVFLLRCLHCQLPVQIRVRHFMQNFPELVTDMEGWTSWDKRRQEFEAEEKRLYGIGKKVD